MKKTLLALSVLVASTAANAGIELYNKDGASVTMGGDLEVVYKRGIDEGSKTQQEIQDADFSFDARYAVSDALTIGAFWEFAGDAGNTTEGVSPSTGNTYFGFYSAQAGSLKIGKLDNVLDDMGVGSDYQFGLTAEVDDMGLGGDEAIRWDYSAEMFYASLSFRDNQRGGEDLADGKIGVKVADLDLTGYYGTSSSADFDVFGVEARYALDALNLEAGFYSSEDRADVVALAADYTMDAWKFAVGYDMVSAEVSTDDVNSYFVNVGYGIAPSTTLYAEIGGNDVSGSETGYAAGVKVAF